MKLCTELLKELQMNSNKYILHCIAPDGDYYFSGLLIMMSPS